MSKNSNFSGISQIHQTLIIQIITAYLPNAMIYIFGSRAKKHAKQYSDLDVVVKNSQKIPLEILGQIKAELNETDIPYTIDLVDYARVDDDFKKIIDETSVRVF